MYLEHYKIKLRTLAPVFIGSGQQVSKREYVLDRRFVYMIDSYKLMQKTAEKNIIKKFEEYMLSRPVPLKVWLDSNNIKDYKAISSYILEGTENINDKRSLKGIDLCLKDAYKKPYIPGSTLKGVLRNIILWNEVYDRFYDDDISDIRKNIANAVVDSDRRSVKKAISYPSVRLEKTVFNKITEETDTSKMRGLIIGDSKPLSLNDITLCGKIDVDIEGNKNPINILRECIKPGVDIEFDLTVDKEILGYDAENIKKMVSNYAKDYFDIITSVFQDNGDTENAVFVGGGTGYFSKTVTYNLFSPDEAVEFTKELLAKTTPKEHKHFKDKIISPHMQKCTEYCGELYEMGKCQLEIVKNY